MTLTAISSERYFAICHPLKFPSTFRRTRLTISCIWLLSCIIATPEFQAVDVHRAYDFTPIRSTCLNVFPSNYRIAYQATVFAFIFLIPFLLMALAYCRIACILWSSTGPNYTKESVGGCFCFGGYKKGTSRSYNDVKQEEIKMTLVRSHFIPVGQLSRRSKSFLCFRRQSEVCFEECQGFEEVEVVKRRNRSEGF